MIEWTLCIRCHLPVGKDHPTAEHYECAEDEKVLQAYAEHDRNYCLLKRQRDFKCTSQEKVARDALSAQHEIILRKRISGIH